MKILIITYFFPPLNNVASGRPYSWAYYFSKWGGDVTVFTTIKTEKDGVLNYVRDCSNFELIQIPLVNFQKIKFIKWIYDGLQILRDKKFDVIISTSNPWHTHVLAMLYKKKNPFTKWVADFRDLWAKNHYRDLDSLKMKLHYFLEKRVINRADAIATVSEPLSEEMRAEYPNTPVFTIYNGYEKLLMPKEKRKDKITISYLGTVYPQRQKPLLLLLAIKQLILEGRLRIEEISVDFYGYKHKLEPVYNIVEKDEIFKKFVHIHNVVSREESIRIQNKSHLLLLLEWCEAKTKGILTGKLFEYLASGTPIISVGQDSSFDASQIIQKAQAGFVCGNDIECIKKAIMDVKEGKYTYKPNYKFIKEFSREKQAKKLWDILNQILKKVRK